MKKNIKIIILIALIVMLLCGCNTNNNSTPTNNVVEENQNAKDGQITDQSQNENDKDKDANLNKTKEYDHSLVCDRWAESGTIKVASEIPYEFKYNYKAPQIVDDTEDAKAINDLIEAIYKYINDNVKKSKETGSISDDDYYSVRQETYYSSYECYWNDSVASIVLNQPNYMDEVTPYMVFNYDFETRKQLNNFELLAKKGISMEQYIEDIRRAVAYDVDNSIKQFLQWETPIGNVESLENENIQGMYVRYLMTRSKNIHEDNINEVTPIYMDAQGELKAIINILDMGLVGNHTGVLSAVPKKNYEINERSDDRLYVESKEDGIYITINESEWAQNYSEGTSLVIGKEYKINGAYKNYCDAAVSWVGNGMQPYVLLISDDGMVSYVDVQLGILYGYLSAVEPMIGLYDIKTFEKYSEGNVIMAKNHAGEIINVDEVLYIATAFKYVDFERTMLELEPNTSYCATVTHKQGEQNIMVNENIGFYGEEYYSFTRNTYQNGVGAGQIQKGFIIFNGMNEKGIVYSFYLTTESGEYLLGAMVMNTFEEWNDSTGYIVKGAIYSSLGGYDIFETNGEEIVLSIVAG